MSSTAPRKRIRSTAGMKIEEIDANTLAMIHANDREISELGIRASEELEVIRQKGIETVGSRLLA